MNIIILKKDFNTLVNGARNIRILAEINGQKFLAIDGSYVNDWGSLSFQQCLWGEGLGLIVQGDFRGKDTLLVNKIIKAAADAPFSGDINLGETLKLMGCQGF